MDIAHDKLSNRSHFETVSVMVESFSITPIITPIITTNIPYVVNGLLSSSVELVRREVFLCRPSKLHISFILARSEICASSLSLESYQDGATLQPVWSRGTVTVTNRYISFKKPKLSFVITVTLLCSSAYSDPKLPSPAIRLLTLQWSSKNKKRKRGTLLKSWRFSDTKKVLIGAETQCAFIS